MVNVKWEWLTNLFVLSSLVVQLRDSLATKEFALMQKQQELEDKDRSMNVLTEQVLYYLEEEEEKKQKRITSDTSLSLSFSLSLCVCVSIKSHYHTAAVSIH